jgi:hypothetical protein
METSGYLARSVPHIGFLDWALYDLQCLDPAAFRLCSPSWVLGFLTLNKAHIGG